MHYMARYLSPLGEIILTADEQGLTGLGFADKLPPAGAATAASPYLTAATRWLDAYFAGERPEERPRLHMLGTPFQLEVWRELLTIPYGQTITYGEIAARLAKRRGIPRFAAQAVGGAVGRNPVGIIVPCHRVMGAAGNLTGFGGGIERKAALLRLEGAWQADFHLPPEKKPKQKR